MNNDVVFECPHCGQWLESPPDMVGLFIECPKCEAIIKVPASGGVSTMANPSSTPPSPPEEKPDDDNLKGSTIRIQLPPNYGMPPETPKRRLIIRRKNK